MSQIQALFVALKKITLAVKDFYKSLRLAT